MSEKKQVGGKTAVVLIIAIIFLLFVMFFYQPVYAYPSSDNIIGCASTLENASIVCDDFYSGARAQRKQNSFVGFVCFPFT